MYVPTPAVDEDLFQGTATADDEQDHGNGQDGILDGLHDIFHGFAPAQAEGTALVVRQGQIFQHGEIGQVPAAGF